MEIFTNTHENLSSTSRKGLGNLLVLGKALASAFTKKQSFFNVSRENTIIYILLAILKNAFVCYGISNIIPQSMTVLLLVTLTCYRLALFEGRFILDLFRIWASWGVVLCFNSGVIRSRAIKRFLISLATLSVVTIFFPTHSSEFIIDVFCIISLTCYIFKNMCGPLVVYFEWFILETTAILIPLALDVAFRAKGLIFDLCILHMTLLRGLLIVILQRKPLFAIILAASSIYCIYEKIYLHRLQDVTAE